VNEVVDHDELERLVVVTAYVATLGYGVYQLFGFIAQGNSFFIFGDAVSMVCASVLFLAYIMGPRLEEAKRKKMARDLFKGHPLTFGMLVSRVGRSTSFRPNFLGDQP
jgi:hypothetical protein